MAVSQNFRAFTPEIWSPKVNEELEKRIVAADFFDSYSDEVVAGGDTIWVPNITSDDMTATDIQTTNGEITPQSIADTKSSLTIDKWKGVAYHVSDFQHAQIASKYAYKEAYARRMGYKLADTFDTALLSEYSNITPRAGDSATAVSASNLEEGMRILNSNSVPRNANETVLFCHPKTYWTDLMGTQKYYDASQFGKATVPKGTIDMLYGIPVVVTENVQTSASGTATMYMNMLAHKSSIIYAMGNLPNGMTTSYKTRIQEKDGEHNRVKYIADIMYGLKTLNSKRAVVVRGK